MGNSKLDKPKVTEEIEKLDIRGTANSRLAWVEDYVREISKQPAAKQVAIGGASGWVVGYLSMKIGKIAATVIGGSLIVFQIASHQGYVKINWAKVNKDLEKGAKKLQKEVESQLNPSFSQKGAKDSLEKHLNKKLQSITSKLEENIGRVEQHTESWVNKRCRSAQRLYRKYILNEDGSVSVEDLYLMNMYIIAFTGGTMLGIAMGKIL